MTKLSWTCNRRRYIPAEKFRRSILYDNRCDNANLITHTRVHFRVIMCTIKNTFEYNSNFNYINKFNKIEILSKFFNSNKNIKFLINQLVLYILIMYLSMSEIFLTFSKLINVVDDKFYLRYATNRPNAVLSFCFIFHIAVNVARFGA